MHTKLRRSAIEMRKKGKTYTEIKKELQVPKSTLSVWLQNLPLTEIQIQKLEQHRQIKRLLSIEKIRNTKYQKKKLRLEKIYLTAAERLFPISQREFYIAGLLLYLGEGTKGDNSTISLNNSNPSVVKFYLYWLLNGLKIQHQRIRVALQLYKDMNIVGMLDYWSKYLRISKNQFIKPYIKNTLRSDIDQKGFGKGTCGLYVYDRKIKLQIMGELEAICSIPDKTDAIIMNSSRP